MEQASRVYVVTFGGTRQDRIVKVPKVIPPTKVVSWLNKRGANVEAATVLC